MHRTRRVGRVVVMAMLGVATVITQASAARDAIREYPQGEKCPVHFGPVPIDNPLTPLQDEGGPLVFTAYGSTAKLTFVSCNDRGGANVNISLDHVMVVESSVFNNPDNRLQYPEEFLGPADEVVLDYGIALKYLGSNPVCYNSPNEVIDVFERAKAIPFTKAMPFYDDFDGVPLSWELANSRIAEESLDTPRPGRAPENTKSKSLILTRATAENEGTCASASIKVSNLIKTRQYVVDFSWFVSPDAFNAGQPLVTVCLAPQVPGTGPAPSPLACGVAR